MEALTKAQGLENRVNNAVNKLIGRIQDETTPPSDKPDATDSVSGENSGG